MSVDDLTPSPAASIPTALAELERAPLSRKKAMLLALLIDRAVDESASGDLLGHRRQVATGDLGTVMMLAAMHDEGPRFAVDAVPLEDPTAVSEADYMVSVYNGGTMQRVQIAWPDGRREDALPVLRGAAADVRRESPSLLSP